MIALLLSLIAGALSTLSPCVLPIVPIVMSSAMQSARFGPVALLSGVVLSYTLVGTALALFGSSMGVHSDQPRIVSAMLMLLFGITFLVPAVHQAMIRLVSPLTDGANSKLAGFSVDSTTGQALLGLMLGVVWSPCVGPTLGAAVTLAANRNTALEALITMFAFGIGAAIPMGLLAYGSRAAMGTRRKTMADVGRWGKRVMGLGLVLVAVLILSGADRAIETAFTNSMPAWLVDLTTRY
ncbi:MAG: cytochrome c biogenesis CcdA family protein [Pseudomonadota bacterium]